MGLKIKIIIAAILFCVITTGYFYIEALQGKLEAAVEVQQRLQGVVDQQKMVLDRNEEDMKRMQEVNNKIADEFSNSQTQLSDLRSKFNRIDLSEAAASKPTEIEMKVNRATQDALRCNELVTGAKLTDDEKSGKSTNHICSDFIKRQAAKDIKNEK